MSRPWVFAGTPAFAAHMLDALLAADWRPAAVLTQPDRPAGRGKRLAPSTVKQHALDAGIEVLDPVRLKPGPRPGAGAAGMAPDEALERLNELQPELMIVAAYGLILPPAVLELPQYGCLNVHASLLPRWRGAAPVERAIMAGDERTGVCIMQMDAGLDTGAVWKCRSTAIGPRETGGELEARLADLGATTLLEVLERWPLASGTATAQPDAGVTYATKLTRSDAVADFEMPAADLARRIRALNPRVPVAASIDSTRLRLLRADYHDDDHDAAPGTIVAAHRDGIHIACARGTLVLLEAQVLKGKARILSSAELLNGFAALLAPGQRLHVI